MVTIVNIEKFVQMGCLVIATYAAWSGVSAWKQQLSGRRDHDLALRFLIALRKYVDEISWLRCPLLCGFEYPNFSWEESLSMGTIEQQKFKQIQYIYNVRLNKLEAARVDLLEISSEAEVIFGEEKIRNIFLKIAAIEYDVRSAVSGYINSENPLFADGAFEEVNTEVNSEVLYDTKEDNDIIRMRMSEPLQEFYKLLEPKLYKKDKWKNRLNNMLLRSCDFYKKMISPIRN